VCQPSSERARLLKTRCTPRGSDHVRTDHQREYRAHAVALAVCAVVCRPGVAGYAGVVARYCIPRPSRPAICCASSRATAAKCGARVYPDTKGRARIAKRRGARLHRQRRASAGASPKRHSPEMRCHRPICLPDCPAPHSRDRMAYSMDTGMDVDQIPSWIRRNPRPLSRPPRVLRESWRQGTAAKIVHQVTPVYPPLEGKRASESFGSKRSSAGRNDPESLQVNERASNASNRRRSMLSASGCISRRCSTASRWNRDADRVNSQAGGVTGL